MAATNGGASDGAAAAAPAVGTVDIGPLRGVSRIGFGAMGVTAFYGEPLGDDDATALLNAVLDAGCNLIDTAEIYRSGNPMKPDDKTVYNEAVIGKALKDVPRESYFVATKYFPGLHEGAVDAAAVEAAVDASRARLGVDTIDLYYLHRPPATVEQLCEWMAAAKAVVDKGKVKAVGLSEVSGAWLRRAHAVHPVAALQMEWSALTRNIESEVVPAAAELGVAIVAYSPLARNLLAAPPDATPADWRGQHPRYQAENLEKNKQLVAKLADAGKALGATPAQLSLAWLYHRAAQLGVTVVPIPGTTKQGHMRDNVAALRFVPLDDAVANTVSELSALVAGARANESYVQRGFESL